MKSPRVKVRLFHELRASIGQSELDLEANTLNDVVALLVDRQSGVKELFFDLQGKLRNYTQFYVNNKFQNPPHMDEKLNDGDLILLVPAATGG